MLRIPIMFDGAGLPVPAFERFCKLEGTNYLLSFRWNRRAATWIMDVGDSSGAPIVQGLALRSNTPLFIPAYLNGPPGVFVPVDSSGTGLDPSLTDLGIRVSLLYVTASERKGFNL